MSNDERSQGRNFDIYKTINYLGGNRKANTCTFQGQE